MTEFSEIIKELGGGPAAVMIVVVSLFAWRVLNWWREDTKENNAQIMKISKEATEGLHASAAAIRSLTEEVKRGS
ncbi:hypothetical protein [Celeribacter halophilus]|uniref:Uncharacterized protein n=1 Tax=Celeribacter halophilus TaxID=576117 RepID=A0A1I3X5I1_9RHOB|nr:hypothetical protein [Celeribacter halophilus]PZX03795.1 hypothetical protein LX82_03742 [Celeribacter halophilus]SFK14863.1 hypothetical protein SAMN04488138_14013 [Celeribacter halophilus]